MDDMKSFSAWWWEQHYREGKTSGEGSYGCSAEFKARVINSLLTRENLQTAIEFGHGDGHQLSLLNYPKYLGFDVSPMAVHACTEAFKSNSNYQFKLLSEYAGETADVALSLDVLYHLIEQDVWEDYLRRLFAAATKYVVIFAVNTNDNPEDHAPHMYYREFCTWITTNIPGWKLVQTADNPCGWATKFYIYAKS